MFDTLRDTGEDYETAIEKLDEFFLPKKNVDYKIFKSRQANENIDETNGQLATRLRKLVAHGEFIIIILTRKSNLLLFKIVAQNISVAMCYEKIK